MPLRHRRTAGFALASALLATSCLSLPAQAQIAAPAAKSANPAFSFAQGRSDLTPDPKARFGKLANGMTYVIYRNATPKGTAAIRLRFDAGSLMEQDYQRGLAHFLEHMAFNGSKNVPEGEMIRILERRGLKFGPDTNASTSQNETIYMLDLPDVAKPTLDDSMFLMRELAGNMTLGDGAVDRERGVILGEERARASAGMRANESLLLAGFPGQKYPVRQPIGRVEVIEHAKPQDLRDFYRDFYRPEYATLVVVGDIDPDAIEADIKKRFGDWSPPPQSPNAATDFGVYQPKGIATHAYVEPGLSRNIGLIWSKPYVAKVETSDKDVEDMLASVAGSTLGQRFRRQSHDPATAFQSASFGKQQIKGMAEIYQLDVNPKEGMIRPAFEQALTIVRQYLAYGVTKLEVDKVLRDLDARYTAGVAMEQTRETRLIAAIIVQTLGSDSVFTSPTQDRAAFTAMKPRLTAASVNAYLKKIDLGDGPLIAQRGESVSDFDQNAALQAYTLAMAKTVTPIGSQADIAWPYTQIGKPGDVVSRTAVPAMGMTRMVFRNGVTLNVKSTHLTNDQVIVGVAFDRGFIDLPANARAVVMAANSAGLTEGGLNKIGIDDLQDALAGKIVDASFGIGEGSSAMRATTTTTDFATQMQLMMAYATDPAFDPRALARYKQRLPDYFRAIDRTPGTVFGTRSSEILHDGDPRYRFPTQPELAAVTNQQVKSLITGILATAPIEISIVGDISEADAIAQVAKTFGSLPRRAPVKPQGLLAYPMHFPTSDLHRVLEHKGRADQNQSFVAWPTTDFYADRMRSAGLGMLAEVLQLRLLDEIRERQGASYSAGANSAMSASFKGYGMLTAAAGVKPEIDQVFYDSVAKIVADLKAKPVGADELERARKPEVARMRNNRQENGYWSSLIDQSASDPRKLTLDATAERDALAVDPALIQRLAIEYLDMAKALRIQVKPAAKVATAGG